jgi:cytochrome c553
MMAIVVRTLGDDDIQNLAAHDASIRIAIKIP